MNTVDERIVEMQFDNKQFESGVQTSLKTLDSLKKGLNLDESARSLNNLSAAGKSFSLAGISSGVDAISSKFTSLGIVGITTLQNITNSAVNCGKRVVSAFTIDPIKTGFSEYETQINAVQTILANTSSKGTTIDQVNSALNELNTYADKTIYNFTEMTRNIGTFTAAGVDLKKSTSSIKGIANLAALSGSNSQQASTAMYQLSQAISSGTVKLQDWNSVVNAGMGGQVFQDALKDTARVHGIAIDDMIKSEGSFRETLQKGWLTSSILTETLDKFTGDLNADQLKTMGYSEEQVKAILKMGQTANDAATKVKTFSQLWDTLKEAAQSGWTQSWQILIGDFEEAKSLLTDVSNVLGTMIGASANARNEMLQGWKDLGGRATLIEAVRNAFEGILSVIKPVKEAFRDIFPSMTAEQLNNLTIGLKNFTAYLKMGETDSLNLKNTFKGLFAILDIGKQALTALFGAFKSVITYLLPASQGLLGFTGSIGEWLVSVDEAIKKGNFFNQVFEKIGKIVKPVADTVKSAVDTIIGAFKAFASIDLSILDGVSDRIKERFAPLGLLGGIVSTGFGAVIAVLKKVAPLFETLGSKIGDAIGKVIDSVKNLDFSTIFDMFNTGVFSVVLIGIKKFMDSLSGITGGSGNVLKGITGILDGVKGSLEAWQTSIKAGALLKIAGALAILSASLIALSLIDSAKLTGALAAISVLFIELFATMSGFEKIASGKGFASMSKITIGMIGLSTAVLILSAAVKSMAELDWNQLVRGLTGVAGLSAILVMSADKLSKGSKKLIKGGLGLIAFALAIKVLGSVVKDLSSLDTGELTKGLVGVGVLCAELAVFLKTSNLNGLSLGKGLGFITLAAGVRILAESVKVFGELDAGSLVKGLSAMGATLLELAAFTKLTGNAKNVIATATGLTILGAAMLIFTEAVGKFGSMSLTEIGKGLLAMGGSLGEVTLAMNLMPKDMISKSVGLIGVASALVIMSKALASMGSMSGSAIAKSLIELGGALAILAVSMQAMTGSISGAAALLVVAGALAILTPSLVALGNMSVGEIVKSLVALAGAFTVIGLAGVVLAPITPVLITLGGAISLIGVGCLAAGVGLLAFSTALSALAVSGAAGIGALVLAISSIISLIPAFLEQIGAGIVAFAGVIAEGAPAILEAVTAVLSSIIGAIATVAPQLVETVVYLIDQLLRTIATYVPSLVKSGFDIIVGFLKGIRDHIGDVVETAVEIVTNFILAIGNQIPVVVQAGFDLIIKFINGLGEAIKKDAPILVSAIIGLAGDMVEGLVGGLFAGLGSVKDAVIGLGKTALDGLKNFLGIHSPSKEFQKIGQFSGDGLVLGIKDKLGLAKDTSSELGQGILTSIKNTLGINSPSKVLNQQVGQQSVVEIANGIKSNTSAEDAATQKAQNIVNAFKTELDKADLKSTTADLEYKLWTALYGDTATDSQKASAQVTELTQKLASQSEKVSLAQKEYDTTLKTFGSSSSKTREAYNKLLQTQIDLADLSTQLNTAQNGQAQSMKSKQNEYYKYLQENTDTLLKMGFSMKEIEANAKQRTGYDPNAANLTETATTQTAATTAMDTTKSIYATSAQKTLGALTTTFTTFGTSYANALGEGLKKGIPQLLVTTKSMVQSCANAIKTEQSKWVEGASYLVDGFIKGIEDNIERAAAAAAEMAMEAYQAAMSVLQINSPSKKFAELGMYSDLGFANGFKAYSKVASSAASDVGTEAMSTMSSTISRISDVLNSNMDLSPTIRPVLDMSEIQNGGKTISSILGNTVTLSTASALSGVASISRFNQGTNNLPAGSIQSSQTTTNSFVQNNYSPKALSRLDLYRQTKNLFSASKGKVNS